REQRSHVITYGNCGRVVASSAWPSPYISFLGCLSAPRWKSRSTSHCGSSYSRSPPLGSGNRCQLLPTRVGSSCRPCRLCRRTQVRTRAHLAVLPRCKISGGAIGLADEVIE